MAEALEGLGYKYVAGPSGDTNDFVLRQTADLSNGFAWKGQDNYDKVGAAVTGTSLTAGHGTTTKMSQLSRTILRDFGMIPQWAPYSLNELARPKAQITN